MQKNVVGQPIPGFLSRQGWQIAALVVCLALSVLMIVNTQMGGEAMWFWYVTAFHHGVHLYSSMHSPLQPLFVLEMDAWMRMVGPKVIPMQVLSLLHACILLLGCYLLVQRGELPSWQKAITILGCFTIIVSGHSYRFDDYHVIAEFLIVYALLILWILSRALSLRRQILLVTALGLLTGFAITTRVTDGLALLLSAGSCLCIVVPARKFASLVLFVAVATLTILAVVKCTGDPFSLYLSSTIFRAAASKGGSGSIAAAPLRTLLSLPKAMYVFARGGTVTLAAILIVGFFARRFGKRTVRQIFLLQTGFALLMLTLIPGHWGYQLRRTMMLNTSMLYLIVVVYAVGVIVVYRFVKAKFLLQTWDAREVLFLLPIAEWASYSAGAAAEPLTNYYAPLALFLVLVVLLQPLRPMPRWVNASFYSLLFFVGTTCVTGKILIPYSWQNYIYSPMFTNRQLFQHPVYGLMYIDKDLLQFSERVCDDIHADYKGQPELLSLPYPYPNYFCSTPPWHNYVQTFFDTSTRASVETLEGELNSMPPQWIVYQRQLNILGGAEVLYNHGQPLPQRDLDRLLFNKINSGQWKLVDRSNYLGQGGGGAITENGGGWYIIRTRP